MIFFRLLFVAGPAIHVIAAPFHHQEQEASPITIGLRELTRQLNNATAYLIQDGNFTLTYNDYNYDLTAANTPGYLAGNITAASNHARKQAHNGGSCNATAAPIVKAFTSFSGGFTPYAKALREGVFDFGFAGLQATFETNLKGLKVAYDGYAEHLVFSYPCQIAALQAAQVQGDTALNQTILDFSEPFACC